MRKPGDIAAFWDSLTDAQKVTELTNARSIDAKTNRAEMIATLGDVVVKLRRKARDYPLSTQRADLVERWLTRFRTHVESHGPYPELARTIEFIVRDETIGWPGFGTKIYRD